VSNQPVKLSRWVAAAGATLALASSGFAQASDATQARTSCFLSTEWRGWKSPSPNVIYLRVNVNDVYRLDLSSGSSQLLAPNVHLVNKLTGSPWVCSPLDMQLWVVDALGGFREPLIVKSITKLTPQEAAAIPGKYRP
jgi:hypothetical protein